MELEIQSTIHFISMSSVSTGMYLLGNIYTFFFLSARAGEMQEIPQYDWFRELAQFSYPAGLHLASYVEDLWARHAVFLSYERSWNKQKIPFPLIAKITWR